VKNIADIYLYVTRISSYVYSFVEKIVSNTRYNRVSFDHDSVIDEYENETLFRMQNVTTKNSAREKWLLARERTRGIRNSHWIVLSRMDDRSRGMKRTLRTRV